jgi:hypothetical protein
MTTLKMTSAGCPDQTLQAIITPACPAPKPPPQQTGGGMMPPSAATSCPWWCWLIGIAAIAIPISAYISSTGTCWLPSWGGALAAAGIGLAIVVFTQFCSVCCLWIIIVIGIVLGVIAWIIAAIIMAYYGIYPNAGCVALGIALIVSFAVTAYAFWMACQALTMASSSSSSSPSSGSSSSGGSNPVGSGPKKHQAIGGAAAAGAALMDSAPEAARVGLGDVVSGTASVLGIRPCSGCQQRARALNALVSVPIRKQA